MTLIRPLALCETNLGSKPMPVLRPDASRTRMAVPSRKLPSVSPSLGFSRLCRMCERHLGLAARRWQQLLFASVIRKTCPSSPWRRPITSHLTG